MVQEQTLVDSKPLLCASSKEIPAMEVNPPPTTMDLESPSPDFADSDGNLGGSITGTPKSDEDPAINETLGFGENEGIVDERNPVGKTNEIVGECSMIVKDDTQVNRNVEENSELNKTQAPVFECSEIGEISDGYTKNDETEASEPAKECNQANDVQLPDGMEDEFENILCDETLESYHNNFVDNKRPIWSEPEQCPVGAGLSNLGSTCFLNAIMQCFTHTVPLVEGLQSIKHDASSHGKDEFCVLCAVCDQIERSLAYSGKKISPCNLVDNLNPPLFPACHLLFDPCVVAHKYFSSFFRRYQQEDAHEFLQCLLDKLDSSWSQYESIAQKLTPSHDSLVKQVFGGSLISQLHCCKCGHNSDSYEPVIDLSLEIDDVDDLESAFKSFTKVENLEDTSNCDNCKEKVQREKQLLLDKAPAIAALHLKRFKSDGGKIDRMVKYPLELNLEPYAKNRRHDKEVLKYELYGIVVHDGLSSTSGHYFSYICTSPDAWYRFDDSKVSKVSEKTALVQEAYILFYARKGTPWFSSLFEQWKAKMEVKANTSPKSVLDRRDVINSVPYVEPLRCVQLDEFDGEDSVSVRELTGASTCLRYGDGVMTENPKDETARTGSETRSLTTGVSTCVRYSDNVMKENLKDDTAKAGCSSSSAENNLFFSPKFGAEIFRSPSTTPGSPDIYTDDEPVAELTFKIPVAHLKVEEKMPFSGKRKVKQESERKEAAKYLKYSPMPSGRRQLLLAAISPDSSSKKKPKQSPTMTRTLAASV